MSAQASFALRGHNPDVLTCIANLSNDEVFTPPEFANRPRIYAIADKAHAGLLKVGQTTRDVKMKIGARRSRCFNSRMQSWAVDLCVAVCREAKRPEGRAPQP